MDGLAGRQLDAIREVVELTGAATIAVWLRGGWAMDFHLGAVSRPHVDVDWYCWRRDAGSLARWRPASAGGAGASTPGCRSSSSSTWCGATSS
ncbi:nucleotidyltransferase domain-containing protein [Micromonospora sp. AP08]|uniref:nucleotidyltransferase domain-containing protein n=1 Tax=Micromonospora sp. AP08 TaxID=2604467 RepID=UPI0021025FAE|nr:hypothetical protein [Micromonospora sp. AP08]